MINKRFINEIKLNEIFLNQNLLNELLQNGTLCCRKSCKCILKYLREKNAQTHADTAARCSSNTQASTTFILEEAQGRGVAAQRAHRNCRLSPPPQHKQQRIEPPPKSQRKASGQRAEKQFQQQCAQGGGSSYASSTSL